MPIYEYRCAECGHELEAMQRISADALTTCPECASEGLKRLISQTSFVLKGSGWYATDYADKKAAPPAGNDAGSDTSADTKPATDTGASTSAEKKATPAASAGSSE